MTISIASSNINTAYNNSNITAYNRQSGQYANGNVSFGCSGGEDAEKSKFFDPIKKPFKKVYGKLTDKIAKFISKYILEKNYMATIVKRTEKSKIVAHISCATSLVISGLYVHQTLRNKKLDSKKKTTLAINQGLVAGLSAVMGYSLDNVINKQIDKYKIADKFIARNATNPKIGKYIDGIKCAIPIIVFGSVYRFITPVLVTPIANMIGDKINNKPAAKKA